MPGHYLTPNKKLFAAFFPDPDMGNQEWDALVADYPELNLGSE